LEKRILAILCAMDSVDGKGKAGVELFPEFNDRGLRQRPILKRGRGLVIAHGIKRPVATDYVVVCCCYDLALYLATKRNTAHHSLFTQGEVVTKWNSLFAANAMFARFLTDEKGERKRGEMLKENNASEVMCTFREVRAKFADK